MKKSHRYITAIMSLFAMLALIFDSKTALTGAAEGIELCIKTVIPSLFPMMVLSGIITNRMHMQSQLINKLIGIPSGSGAIILAGLMGGYPVGAACISQEYRTGRLSKKDANHLLRFCSNAGPAFILGVGGNYFTEMSAVWQLWVIHIMSAIMTGLMFSNKPESTHLATVLQPRNVTEILTNSVRNTSVICGWILLFRVIICFLQRWILWLFPTAVSVVLSGILELTNGCCMLDQITKEQARFILCSMFLGFGSVCVYLQTAAIAIDLNMRDYTKGKFLQAIFSFLLSSVVSTVLYSNLTILQKSFLSFLLLIISTCIIVFLKKAIAFFFQLRYNTARSTERGNAHAIS